MTVAGSADKWIDKPGEFTLSQSIGCDEESSKECFDEISEEAAASSPYQGAEFLLNEEGPG